MNLSTLVYGTTMVTYWEEITDEASVYETTTTPATVDNHEFLDWEEIFISIILWTMCLFTAIGNALVIGVFIHDRRVRNKVSNLYILNLAVADFIVGCVSLPINYFYRKTGVWPFGEFSCKFWLTVDFTACFESVWAVVLISYDRYLLVTKGLEYDKYQTRRSFAISASVTWTISFFRYFWMFVGYDLFNKNLINYSETCDNQVFYFLPYIVCDWLVTFFFPVVLTLYFNVKLYADIKRRSRGLPRNWATVTPSNPKVVPAEDTPSNTPSQEQPHTSSYQNKEQNDASPLNLIGKNGDRKAEKALTQSDEKTNAIIATETVTQFNNNHKNDTNIIPTPQCHTNLNGTKRVTFSEQNKNNTHQNRRNNNDVPKRLRREGTADIRKHRRTAITLGLIVTVSASCWAPYYVYVFLNFAFKLQVSYRFLTITYYIWWGNSTLNPLLYVATNPGIRNGIAKILRLKK